MLQVLILMPHLLTLRFVRDMASHMQLTRSQHLTDTNSLSCMSLLLPWNQVHQRCSCSMVSSQVQNGGSWTLKTPQLLLSQEQDTTSGLETTEAPGTQGRTTILTPALRLLNSLITHGLSSDSTMLQLRLILFDNRLASQRLLTSAILKEHHKCSLLLLTTLEVFKTNLTSLLLWLLSPTWLTLQTLWWSKPLSSGDSLSQRWRSLTFTRLETQLKTQQWKHFVLPSDLFALQLLNSLTRMDLHTTWGRENWLRMPDQAAVLL